MLRLERISHPHRGVGRFVVVGGIVTLTARLNLQLYRIRIELSVVGTWQLQPTFGWHTTGGATIYRTTRRASIVLSRGRVRGRRGCTPSCSTTRRSLCSVNYLRNLNSTIAARLLTVVNNLVVVVSTRICNSINQVTLCNGNIYSLNNI